MAVGCWHLGKSVAVHNTQHDTTPSGLLVVLPQYNINEGFSHRSVSSPLAAFQYRKPVLFLRFPMFGAVPLSLGDITAASRGSHELFAFTAVAPLSTRIYLILTCVVRPLGPTLCGNRPSPQSLFEYSKFVGSSLCFPSDHS